jgi:hypothetical protein
MFCWFEIVPTIVSKLPAAHPASDQPAPTIPIDSFAE